MLRMANKQRSKGLQLEPTSNASVATEVLFVAFNEKARREMPVVNSVNI